MLQRLRGSSLPTVMVISILICLLVLFAITLFDMNNLFYSNYHRMRQSKEDINSAFVLYCNDSTLLDSLTEQGEYLLYQNEEPISVCFQVKPWGLYECVTVYTPDNKYHSSRMVGKVQDSEHEAALWVCSRNMVLSLTGTSEVEGKTFIPINGISYARFGDTPFQGKEIEDCFIDLSDYELPAIDSTLVKSMDRIKDRKEILSFPSATSAQLYYSFRDSTQHFYFSSVSDQLTIRGNVVLHADDITISSDTRMNDVILVAKKVTIKDGFSGSLQIIASDTVIIKDHVCLQYPSGIFLKGNGGKTYLSLGSHSLVNGYAVVFGDAELSSGIYVDDNYHQDSTAIFRGLLYVDGIADIRGQLWGGVYLKECYYLPDNGVYEGMINNARISRNSQLAYPFLFSQSTYRRREIKTIY